MTWTLARGAIDREFPHETEDQRDLRFMTNIYGDELAQDFLAYRQQTFGCRNGTLA